MPTSKEQKFLAIFSNGTELEKLKEELVFLKEKKRPKILKNFVEDWGSLQSKKLRLTYSPRHINPTNSLGVKQDN